MQGEDFLLVQAGYVLLGEGHLLLVQEAEILIAQEEEFLLVQQELDITASARLSRLSRFTATACHDCTTHDWFALATTITHAE